MAKKKEATEVKETKERAAVGRERRLALALVGLMDAVKDEAPDAEYSVEEAVTTATTLLNDLGYSNLESTAKTLARINEALKIAVENGDGTEIARLGKELEKAQSGKASRAKKATNAPSE